MLERKYIMAEFASKGVAGSGLGLGTAGTAIVPMSAICPTPMAKYNSWTAPTATPATGA